MDMFSFGMVCLWMLFGVDLPLDSTGDDGRLISFEEDCDPATNCLERWKTDDEKDELTTWAISITPECTGPKRNDIISFFKLALAKIPQKRDSGMDVLLQLLDPARYVWGRRIDVSRLLSPLAPARYVQRRKVEDKGRTDLGIRNLPKVKTSIIKTAPTEEHFEVRDLLPIYTLTTHTKAADPPFVFPVISDGFSNTAFHRRRTEICECAIAKISSNLTSESRLTIGTFPRNWIRSPAG